MEILLSIIFGLLSMAGFALSNAFSKPLAKDLGPAQVLFLRGFTILLILGAAAAPSLPHHHQLLAIVLTILLGIAGYIPVLAFTHAIKDGKIGIIAPIAGTSPLITILLSFMFLDVSLSTGQWIAAVVVVLANIAMSFDVKNWRSRQLKKAESGIALALIAALGWGLFFFFLVNSVRALGPWVGAWCAEIGVVLAAGVHSYLQKDAPLHKALDRHVILNGALICLGTLGFTLGTRHNVAIVAAISNSTALLSGILGYFLFKERLQRQEKVAGIVMVLGIAALAVL